MIIETATLNQIMLNVFMHPPRSMSLLKFMTFLFALCVTFQVKNTPN